MYVYIIPQLEKEVEAKTIIKLFTQYMKEPQEFFSLQSDMYNIRYSGKLTREKTFMNR